MLFRSSYNLISDRVEIFISVKCDMRKCRNWQTSKTKDLVSIALVWVQVPSSAFFYFIKKCQKPAKRLFCGLFWTPNVQEVYKGCLFLKYWVIKLVEGLSS